jgi:hypothetical protein
MQTKGSKVNNNLLSLLNQLLNQSNNKFNNHNRLLSLYKLKMVNFTIMDNQCLSSNISSGRHGINSTSFSCSSSRCNNSKSECQLQPHFKDKILKVNLVMVKINNINRKNSKLFIKKFL